MKKLLVCALVLSISSQLHATKTITVENTTGNTVIITAYTPQHTQTVHVPANTQHCIPGSYPMRGIKNSFTLSDEPSSCMYKVYNTNGGLLGSITAQSPKTYYKIVEKNGKLALE